VYADDPLLREPAAVSEQAIRDMLRQADFVHFRSVDYSTALVEKVERLGVAWSGRSSKQANYRVNLEGGYANYLSSLTSRYRNSIRRELRRLEERFDGDINFVLYGEEQVADFLEHAVEIHRNSWKDNRFPEPTAQAIEATSQGDRWYGAILFGGGVAISYADGYVNADRVSVRGSTAYRADYRSVGPSKVLIPMLLERHEEFGFQVLDFDVGDADYKRRYSNEVREVYDARVARRFSRFGAIFGAQRLSDRVYAYIRSLVERFGADSRVRRLVKS
jgi:CelD/BcsL family acetyltransferase involved in cellulose biosynthesis